MIQAKIIVPIVIYKANFELSDCFVITKENGKVGKPFSKYTFNIICLTVWKSLFNDGFDKLLYTEVELNIVF